MKSCGYFCSSSQPRNPVSLRLPYFSWHLQCNRAWRLETAYSCIWMNQKNSNPPRKIKVLLWLWVIFNGKWNKWICQVHIQPRCCSADTQSQLLASKNDLRSARRCSSATFWYAGFNSSHSPSGAKCNWQHDTYVLEEALVQIRGFYPGRHFCFTGGVKKKIL